MSGLRIAVVGDATLAQALSQAGLDVVDGGADFQAATSVISAALKTEPRLGALLIVDGPDIPVGAHLWVSMRAREVPTAILRDGAPSTNLPAQSVALEPAGDAACLDGQGRVNIMATLMAMGADFSEAMPAAQVTYPNGSTTEVETESASIVTNHPDPAPVVADTAPVDDDDDDDDADDWDDGDDWDYEPPGDKVSSWADDGDNWESSQVDDWGDADDWGEAVGVSTDIAPLDEGSTNADEASMGAEGSGRGRAQGRQFSLPTSTTPPPAPEPVSEPVESESTSFDAIPEELREQFAAFLATKSSANEQGMSLYDLAVSPVADMGPTGVPHRSPGSLCPVIFVTAGKGGVGKSMTSIALAQYAAKKMDGLRVTLVDMNRGQGDLRTFLRLARVHIPDIYRAAMLGSNDGLLITPQRMTELRGAAYGEVGFAFIAAPEPEPESTDPKVVTADVYLSAIEHARRHSDLVVVDTQIAESRDTSGLYDEVTLPIARDDDKARILGITDGESAGFENLQRRFKNFAERSSVPVNRMMLMLNNFRPSMLSLQEEIIEYIGSEYHYVGTVVHDEDLEAMQSAGHVDYALLPAITTVLSEVAYRTTGIESFNSGGPAALAIAGKARTGLLSRIFRGRK